MRLACLIALPVLLASTAAASSAQLVRFKLPGPGFYEQTSVVRGPGDREQRDTARLCAVAGAPSVFTGVPAALQARCITRVLEDNPSRARLRTECGGGDATDTLMERTALDRMRTTIVLHQGGREFMRTVSDSRRITDACPPAVSAPSPVISLPQMPAADQSVCTQGAAEIARVRTNAGIPAATREQLVSSMQSALRMQGCKL